MVERVGMAGEREGKLGEVVDVNLRLVCAGTHDPVAIITYTDAVASLFEFEILEKLDAVLVLDVVLQTSLATTSQPFGKRSSGGRA